MPFTQQEREYLADIFQWAHDCKIQTCTICTYLTTDPKTVGNGKPHRKYMVFKCTVYIWEGNKLVDKSFEDQSIINLRMSMGKFMHERWDKLKVVGDSEIQGISPDGVIIDELEEEDCF